MRRGHNNSIIKNDEGKVVAINFGSDYCSEHEWGIKGVQETFGIKTTLMGIKKKLITKTSPRLLWHVGTVKDVKKQKSFEGFWLSQEWMTSDYNPEPSFYKDDALYTAWSERDFGVFSVDPVQIEEIREVFNALKNTDAAIWLGGGGVFENAGFVIGIASRLSQEVKDLWQKHDEEKLQLEKDAQATGIEDRIKKAGLGFFALSPRRNADGSVIFWLNPTNQQDHNFGWFTVKDLDDWIAGDGPVPKKSKK